jgi:hypothetical protein
MKITIKIAHDGDDSEGCVYSQTFVPIEGARLSKLLDIWLRPFVQYVHSGRVNREVDVPALEHRLTVADKKFLASLKIGGLE